VFQLLGEEVCDAPLALPPPIDREQLRPQHLGALRLFERGPDDDLHVPGLVLKRYEEDPFAVSGACRTVTMPA
jgi:hypothetical protein